MTHNPLWHIATHCTTAHKSAGHSLALPRVSDSPTLSSQSSKGVWHLTAPRAKQKGLRYLKTTSWRMCNVHMLGAPHHMSVLVVQIFQVILLKILGYTRSHARCTHTFKMDWVWHDDKKGRFLPSWPCYLPNESKPFEPTNLNFWVSSRYV